jgi:3-hydroxyacyl-[acyl-carrier-protein] dehydratase
MLDRITQLVPGDRIVAERELTGQEDYLADHFPLFPVMPGVLMLEAMFQGAAWLMRVSDDFEHTVIRLKEARNVKYSDFVQPGQTLIVKAEIKKREGLVTTLQAHGVVHGDVAVQARLLLENVPLDDHMPGRSSSEAWTRKLWRDRFRDLTVELRTGVPLNV